MSKASEYAKAVTRPKEPPKPDHWTHDGNSLVAPEFLVADDGGLIVITEHSSPTIPPAHVPAFIKWLRETYED